MIAVDDEKVELRRLTFERILEGVKHHRLLLGHPGQKDFQLFEEDFLDLVANKVDFSPLKFLFGSSIPAFVNDLRLLADEEVRHEDGSVLASVLDGWVLLGQVAVQNFLICLSLLKD